MKTEQMFSASNRDRSSLKLRSIQSRKKGEKPMFQSNQILACVIRQYCTGLYQACVSFNKGHTVFLSAHHDEDSANETIDRFQEACRGGTRTTAEDVTSFARSLA